MDFSEKYIYGTAKLHHLLFKHRIYRLLDTAYGVGFRTFDTSPYYGLGLNERVLLMWIKSRNLNDVNVHTKVGLSYPVWRSRTLFGFVIQRALLSAGLCSTVTTKARLKIYKEHDLKPRMLLIHEPSNFNRREMSKLSRENGVDDIFIGGYAGSLKNVESSLTGNLIYQVPFDDYPNGDVFYGIFSSRSKIFRLSLEGRFIYGTNNIKRLRNFANGKL